MSLTSDPQQKHRSTENFTKLGFVTCLNLKGRYCLGIETKYCNFLRNKNSSQFLETMTLNEVRVQ